MEEINLPGTGETIEVGLGHFAVFALDAPLPDDDLFPVLLPPLPDDDLLPVLLHPLPALLRIQDPDFYPSRISDPKTAMKDRGEIKIVVIPFFLEP
jgi:hypothetical protein